MKFNIGDKVRFVYPEDVKEDTWCEFNRGETYTGVVTEALKAGSWAFLSNPTNKTKVNNDMYSVEWEVETKQEYILAEDLLEGIDD